MEGRIDWQGRGKFLIAKADGSAIPDDEPIFVLRGQDCLAAPFVKAYADAFEGATGDKGVANQIRHLAEDFALWPTKKIPD